MFELTLSKKQFGSAIFLQQLLAKQGDEKFILLPNLLISQAPFDNAVSSSHHLMQDKNELQSNLLVFGEGLCLAQLSQIEQALAAKLVVDFWQVIQVEGILGFAINAKVRLIEQDAAQIKSHIEKLAEQFSLELCLFKQTPQLNEPGLLLMDMDSTVIAVECIDEIAALAGVGEKVSAVTAQAMQGKLDFAQSLRTRVACLAEADESILRVVKEALPLMPGAANLVAVLKRFKWKVAIASGGFTYFADYLAERLELDDAVANTLEIIDGKLSGKVEGGIVDAQVKAHTLSQLAERWKIDPMQTVAMGDGANDLAMMSVAALGVALHAKPIVRQQADIAISRAGLDALVWVLAV